MVGVALGRVGVKGVYVQMVFFCSIVRTRHMVAVIVCVVRITVVMSPIVVTGGVRLCCG